MALTELELSVVSGPLPADVRAFLREAEGRVSEILRGCHFPGFVASDYAGAYRALRALSEMGVARGRLFCEWGSGLGVITCLAAMLEFDAFGIEIEPGLIDAAQQLADDFELPVQFTRGSFIPRGGARLMRDDGGFSWLSTDETGPDQSIGLDTDDFDVVFSYPWPDEEGFTADLFDRFGGVGAVLLTHHGGEEFRLRRKKSR